MLHMFVRAGEQLRKACQDRVNYGAWHKIRVSNNFYYCRSLCNSVMADHEEDTELLRYFSPDQLAQMGSYERSRNKNLISNYNYMKSIGKV